MARLTDSLPLASGSVLPNRLGKAAMEESLADAGQQPGARLLHLYRTWASGGAGLLITGNVMVDARAMTGPAGVVLDSSSDIAPFRRWAQVAKSGGGMAWMQINHPGRLVYADLPGVRWSPSEVPVALGKQSHRFARPTPMTAEDIRSVIGMHADTAQRAEEAGFDGVEVHAAHGYLLAQFLSPLVNRRTDEWGGSLENRGRLLLEVVRKVRAAVSPGFAVAVKLNSADFQRGGFDQHDAARVLQMLGPLGVDLVELSGGSAESPAMQGRTADDRTMAREAYFLALAEELVRAAPMPLMLTGGITRKATAERVLESGVAVVGLGSALALRPSLPQGWLGDEGLDVVVPHVQWKDKALTAAAQMAIIRYSLRRLAAGRRPRPRVPPLFALAHDRRHRRRALSRYAAWLDRRPRMQPAEPGATPVEASAAWGAGSR
ncbi:MAG: 2,4-dienoyl-CoA reductase [Frankiales bacterium]|nr:2,4-dienoyl-CoA reductase [Frankiales bacterium]